VIPLIKGGILPSGGSCRVVMRSWALVGGGGGCVGP
jgi:hypothetical protein